MARWDREYLEAMSEEAFETLSAALVSFLARHRLDDLISAWNEDPDGEDWAFCAAENMMSVSDYTQARFWEIENDVQSELVQLTIEQREVLLCWMAYAEEHPLWDLRPPPSPLCPTQKEDPVMAHTDLRSALHVDPEIRAVLHFDRHFRLTDQKGRRLRTMRARQDFLPGPKLEVRFFETNLGFTLCHALIDVSAVNAWAEERPLIEQAMDVLLQRLGRLPQLLPYAGFTWTTDRDGKPEQKALRLFLTGLSTEARNCERALAIGKVTQSFLDRLSRVSAIVGDTLGDEYGPLLTSWPGQLVEGAEAEIAEQDYDNDIPW